jgi:hypothetical protein
MSLDFLDSLGDVVDKSGEPSSYEFALYMFWEKGISYEEFKKLPIPYTLSIIKTHRWVKQEEEKAYKKAQRKK